MVTTSSSPQAAEEIFVMENPYLGAMVKPVNGRCNLNCTYCYYRPIPEIVNEAPRLGFGELERFIRDYLEISTVSPTMVWQGGEPLLAGIEFYERAIELQKKYNKASVPVTNVIQSNGTLVTEEWAEFFSRNRFLVGVSVDGPPEVHNRYRRDAQGTHDRAMNAIMLLRKMRVDFNVLVAVTDANVRYASEVYDFFRGERINFIEIIPVAELGSNNTMKPYSITPRQYGDFLVELFEVWIGDNPQKTHIRLLDNVVRSFFGIEPEYCIFRDTCYNVLTLEANGSLYPCDFYVSREWMLGNIRECRAASALNSKKWVSFKRLVQSYRQECHECRWFSICKGGCTKYRSPGFMSHAKGGNYFCESLRMIFEKVESEWENFSAKLQSSLRKKYGVPEMPLRAEAPPEAAPVVGRNDPCPCGSGKKFKHCCLRKMAAKD